MKRNIWMAIAITLIVVGMSLIVVGRANAFVTHEQFDQVKVGMSRAHVENVVFEGDHGVRGGLWAGPHRRHLEKDYLGEDGTWVTVWYIGPLCKKSAHPHCGPFAGPFHVERMQMERIMR
jgi:hypothetical protein